MKDVKNRVSLLHNRDMFKSWFEDEIKFNIQRAGFWDSENIDDKDVVQ